MRTIIRCPYCGQFYKTKKFDKGYVTDFGDIFRSKSDVVACLKCGKKIKKENFMTMENWIADMLFRIKG